MYKVFRVYCTLILYAKQTKDDFIIKSKLLATAEDFVPWPRLIKLVFFWTNFRPFSVFSQNLSYKKTEKISEKNAILLVLSFEVISIRPELSSQPRFRIQGRVP